MGNEVVGGLRGGGGSGTVSVMRVRTHIRIEKLEGRTSSKSKLKGKHFDEKQRGKGVVKGRK